MNTNELRDELRGIERGFILDPLEGWRVPKNKVEIGDVLLKRNRAALDEIDRLEKLWKDTDFYWAASALKDAINSIDKVVGNLGGGDKSVEQRTKKAVWEAFLQAFPGTNFKDEDGEIDPDVIQQVIESAEEAD